MRKSPAAVHAENPTAFINLLRFTGAISIAVFLHYSDHFLPPLGLENPFTSRPVHWLMHYASVFVEMYFIISGYLFAVVYRPRIRAGLTFDRFFTGRIVRIVPLTAITCVVCFLENLLLFCINGTLWRTGTLSIWSLVRDILFGGGTVFHASFPVNGPAWYVNVLMFCYVIAFILTKFSHTHNIYILPIFTGVMIQYSGVEFALWNLHAARGYIAFFLGVILGIILQSWKKLSGRGVLLIRIIMALELFIVFIVFVFFHSSAAVDRQFLYKLLFIPCVPRTVYINVRLSAAEQAVQLRVFQMAWKYIVQYLSVEFSPAAVHTSLYYHRTLPGECTDLGIPCVLRRSPYSGWYALVLLH